MRFLPTGTSYTAFVPLAMLENVAAWRTQFFASGGRFFFQLGDASHMLAFQPCQTKACDQDALVYAKVRLGGVELEVALDKQGWLNLLTSLLPTGISLEDVDAFPPAITAALAETALDGMLSVIEQATGLQAEITTVNMGRSDDVEGAEPLSGCPVELLPFELCRQDNPDDSGAVMLRGELQIPCDATPIFDALAGLGASSRFSPLTPLEVLNLDTLVFPLAVVLGRVRLGLTEVRDLGPGDLVLPDVFYPYSGDQAQVTVAGRLALPVSWCDTTITILDTTMTDISDENSDKLSQEAYDANEDESTNSEGQDTQPEASDDTTSDAVPTSNAGQLDDLPVDITLELDAQRVTLGQLKSLRPGMILQTQKSLKNPITLKANGKAVAVGELVDIEGRAAVRILRVGKTKMKG
ncbi:type III secretion system cytoplasmic ring protein SctQ [Desulfovibrio inopinatus]|uniref:type III secretion system cytoplasmic ring protein SctQ n=1 Tax=Desulfovibrio inopinatus TaxID=102109 RepID=UPI00040C6282|nr:type III secretion system cytoplasmic ring protein SctQ [Desulfovibrio inopinatus]